VLVLVNLGRGGSPYLEADPSRSVWAATGFGVFCDDLVERILRGDLHHRRTGA
jgi:hypothetical protein